MSKDISNEMYENIFSNYGGYAFQNMHHCIRILEFLSRNLTPHISMSFAASFRFQFHCLANEASHTQDMNGNGEAQ
jgi:hypothetical protein